MGDNHTATGANALADSAATTAPCCAARFITSPCRVAWKPAAAPGSAGGAAEFLGVSERPPAPELSSGMVKPALWMGLRLAVQPLTAPAQANW